MNVNYFKCKYCHKTFVSITDRFSTCKYCGKKEGVIKMDFTKIKNKINEVIKDPLILQMLSNKSLLSFYKYLHTHYYIFRRMEKLGNKLKKEKIKNTIVEKITKVDLYINKELRIRKIKYRINDRLTKNTDRLILEYNEDMFNKYVKEIIQIPIKYSDKIKKTDKFIVEPYIENAERIMIYKKEDKVKIFSEKEEEVKNKVLLNKILGIKYPTAIILDAFLLKNGTLLLQDIVADEMLLKRKVYLMKLKVNKKSCIRYTKFDYCKTKEELKKVLLKYKNKKTICILKPVMEKYDNKAKWAKLSFKKKSLKQIDSIPKNKRRKIKIAIKLKKSLNN